MCTPDQLGPACPQSFSPLPCFSDTMAVTLPHAAHIVVKPRLTLPLTSAFSRVRNRPARPLWHPLFTGSLNYSNSQVWPTWTHRSSSFPSYTWRGPKTCPRNTVELILYGINFDHWETGAKKKLADNCLSFLPTQELFKDAVVLYFWLL